MDHGCIVLLGVTSVETNVAEKTVVVQADPAVSPQDMLAKLQKVRMGVKMLK